MNRITRYFLAIVMVVIVMAGVSVMPAAAQDSTNPEWLDAPLTVQFGGVANVRVAGETSEQLGEIPAGSIGQIVAIWNDRSLVRSFDWDGAPIFGWVGNSYANMEQSGETFSYETTCEVEAYDIRDAKVKWVEAKETYYLFDTLPEECLTVFEGQFEVYDDRIHDLAQVNQQEETLGFPYVTNGVLKFARGTIAVYPAEQLFDEIEAGKDTTNTLWESWRNDILARLELRLPEEWTLREVTLEGENSTHGVEELPADYAKDCEYDETTDLVENALHIRKDGRFEGAIGSQGCLTVFQGQLTLTGSETAEVWWDIREGFVFASGTFTVMPESSFQEFVEDEGLELELPELPAEG